MNIEANDKTDIFTDAGGFAAGVFGLGASVGISDVENTVLAYIGTNTTVDATGTDVSVTAQSDESNDSGVIVASAGGITLSGGVLANSFGKNVGNASYADLSAEDQQNFLSGETQASDALYAVDDKVSGVDGAYRTAYNDALGRVRNDGNTEFKGQKHRR